MLVSTSVLLLASLGFIVYELVTFRDTMVQSLTTQTEIIGINIVSALLFNDPASATQTMTALRVKPNIVSAAIYTADGKLFARYIRRDGVTIFQMPEQITEKKAGYRFDEGYLFLLQPIVSEGERIGMVYMQSDLNEMEIRMKRYASIVAGLLAISLVTAYWVSSRLQGRISAPILHLAQTAKTVSEEKNYSIRATADSRDEIGQLVNTFNEMLTQIQVREDALQKSHDQLEQRVAERTRELQQEIAERTRTEEKFQVVAETANDAIVTADSRGNITYFNKGGERIFGYSASDVVGQPLTLLMPERFHDAHRQGLARFLSTREAHVVGKTVELIGRKKGGGEFPVDLSLASWKAGGETFFTGILRDITDRKQREKDLLVSEERFRLMVEGVTDYAILTLDTGGHIASWNAGTQRLKGYQANEILGQHFSRFYPPEDIQRGKPEHELRVAAAEGRIEDEGWRVRKDGSRFWANVVITAIRNEAGTLCGFSKVTRDLTERKRVEEEMLKLNTHLVAANKELEAFSYSVSHDLRAPLRHINGFIELLKEHAGVQLDAKGQRYTNTISDSAKQMGCLIDDLLVFSRMGQVEMRMSKINLDRLVREVVESLQTETQGRKIVWKIDPLPEVYGDSAMLRQVWINMIGNAVKYTRTRAPAEIEIGNTPNDDKECIFFVRDNGVGFDPQYAGKLFGVFQRLHSSEEFEGTGIGLANVRRIIYRHGGRTWAEGRVDGGAVFYFSLPNNKEGQG